MHISRHLAFHINLHMCLFVGYMLVYQWFIRQTFWDIVGTPMTTGGFIIETTLLG